MLLHRAVLAVGSVQREKDNIRSERQRPRIILRVEFTNRVPQRAQRLHHRGARLERYFPLRGRAAEHHGNVQCFGHSLRFPTDKLY